MKVCLVICILVLPVLVWSQENKTLRFGSIIHAGYHQGSSGAYLGLQAINGVHFRSWYAGVGTGIDYYYLRSVPVFIDVRKALGKKSATPYTYFDLGIGYRTPVLNKLFLTMSAGFSEKRLMEKIENWWTPNGHQEIEYVLRRINLKIGLGF